MSSIALGAQDLREWLICPARPNLAIGGEITSSLMDGGSETVFMKKHPETDNEFVTALEKLGYELIDHDVDSFSVQRKSTGAKTKLEAEDYSSALFEAWNLVKE